MIGNGRTDVKEIFAARGTSHCLIIKDTESGKERNGVRAFASN
jgi:hypothetical protein